MSTTTPRCKPIDQCYFNLLNYPERPLKAWNTVEFSEQCLTPLVATRVHQNRHAKDSPWRGAEYHKCE